MKLTKMRAIVRLGRRSAWRHPWRTGLIGALIGIAVMIAVIVGIVMRTGTRTPEEYMAFEFGASEMIVEFWGSSDDAIAWVDNKLDELVPDSEVTVIQRAYTRDGSYVSVDLFNPLVAGKYAVLEGHAPGDDEIAISWGLSRAENLSVGDTYSMPDFGYSATITAIAAAYGSSSSRIVYLPEDSLGGGLSDEVDRHGDQSTLWLVGGDFDSIAVMRNIGSDFERVAAEFEAPEGRYYGDPYLNVQSRTYAQEMGFYLTTGEQQPSLMSTLAAVLILAEVAFLAAAAYATGIRRRLREIGLTLTQGASAFQIRAAIVSEALVTAIIGAVSGATLAYGLALAARPIIQQRFDPLLTSIEFSFTDAIGPIAVAVAAAVIAAWLPARTASKVSVLAALQGRMPTGRPPGWIIPASIASIALGAILVAVAEGVPGRAATIQAGIGVLLVLFGGALAGVPLVSGAGRIAHRLPPVGRLVARDSSRQAIRAGAAITALLVIVTGTVAIATAMQTGAASRTAVSGDGYGDTRIVFAQGDFIDDYPEEGDSGPNLAWVPKFNLTEERELEVAAILPKAERYEAQILPIVAVSSEIDRHRTDQLGWEYGGQFCIDDGTGGYRCADTQQVNLNPAVIDPDLIAIVASPEAGETLESGTPIVLGSERGTMDVVYEDETFTAEMFPASVPGWSTVRLAVPESWADEHGLMAAANRSVFFVNDVPITEGVRRELHRLDMNAHVGVGEGFGMTVSQARAIMLGVALFAVAVVIAIVIALSSTESSRDLATMVAVGAAPSLRRRFLGLQSWFYVLVSAIVAVPIGLLLMRVVSGNDILFGQLGVWLGGVAVPWQTIGVLLVVLPIVVGLGTALVVRSLPARPPRRAT